jgi:hypothetical protein
MDVFVENKLVLDNLDIVAAAGGPKRAYVATVSQPVSITDGSVTITMNSTINSAVISGIEVIASANIVTHRINCGATAAAPVTMNGVSWARDVYFSTTSLISNRCGTTITNSIYCSSRYFTTTSVSPLRYNIPVPYNNALYQLRLHFNELVKLCVEHLYHFRYNL